MQLSRSNQLGVPLTKCLMAGIIYLFKTPSLTSRLLHMNGEVQPYLYVETL